MRRDEKSFGEKAASSLLKEVETTQTMGKRTTIGGKQDVALIVWVAGKDEGSSAVDSIPDDSTIGDADEWTDSDTFTNLYLLYVN